MKFVCTQENLIQGLSVVSHITGKSINLPVLGNVLLKTEGGNLKLSATNLELAVSTLVRGKVEVEGEYTVPAKLLQDYIGLLPQGKVELELIEEGLKVQASGQETVVRGMAAQEFPLIPKLAKSEGVSFPVDDLKRTITQVAFAVSLSESRPELSGVACWFGGSVGSGSVAFVATDSYRLAERVLKLTKGSMETRLIVPARTMLEVNRILSGYKDELGVPEDVQWVTTENQLVVTFGSTELVSRLIEGSFPDYQQIIPDSFSTEVLLDRSELQKAVKAASLFSRQGLYDVHLAVKPEEGVLEVFSADQGTGKTSTALQGEITGGATNLVVNFKYLSDGLAAINTNKVKLQLNDAMSPMLLLPDTGDEQYRYLVMPIRQ
ncbi:DNA polymerase III subunit beta [Candidatus Uhrbacteria bacterium]|nr:DNA polymerase III subunit beta [Candidatus Uhrbacteria bacterium]MBD3284601.1 DNA polymerase III subunit beta [Candidatus Uhrbacteria bacterium]